MIHLKADCSRGRNAEFHKGRGMKQAIYTDAEKNIDERQSVAAPEAHTENKNTDIQEDDGIDHFELSAVSTCKKETFIPISRYDLFESLNCNESWPEGKREASMEVLKQLSGWRHHVYHQRYLKLNELYMRFDPDRDTKEVPECAKGDCHIAQRHEFTEKVTEILERANYKEITHEKLNEYFKAKGPYGLNLEVDMDEFDDILIYFRGSNEKITEKRTWKKLFLGKEKFAVPTFQRLFLLLKIKTDDARLTEIMEAEEVDEKEAQKILKQLRKHLPTDVCPNCIYLKTFKNIPQSDLEMLFPNIKIKFRPFDKMKLYITAGGGTLGGLFATATKLVAATNPITLALAIFGLGGVIFRQVMNFFNQRNHYMMVLAQNLYFHNLANNRGALTLMLDRAEEEDIKEDMLLYSYLTRHKTCLSKLVEADKEIEDYLLEKFGIDVDYDFTDALERLMKDGIVYEDNEGFINALTPEKAYHHISAKRVSSLNLKQDTAPAPNDFVPHTNAAE